MTIDEFEKRVAETINDTKPARVAGEIVDKAIERIESDEAN